MPVDNPPFPDPGTILAKLCAPIDLRRAWDFVDAPEPALILPEAYGDFSVGGLGGPCPATLISSSTPWVYVAANHPVFSIDNVYIDGVEQLTGFTVDTSAPPPTLQSGLESGYTTIALIEFTDQPTGKVSWRGQGRMDDAGALIVNPIVQLELILRHRAGYALTDFDLGALREAAAAADAAGYETAWVFDDDRASQEWITDIMFNVMGVWRVTGVGQVSVSLDTGGAPSTTDIAASFVAARDCVDGDDGVTMVLDRQNLVNKLQVFYLYDWSERRPSSRLSLESPLSINAYGEIRKSVTLKGHRDSTLVEAWGDILFERQSFLTRVEGAIVKFTVKEARALHVTIGDMIAFTWPYGPRRELGNAYVNEVLRVVSISHDLTDGASAIGAVDTGEYVSSGGNRVLEPLNRS